ncbi:hypothetical protein AZE42_00452 [Rhizopogon vesiculosus]|uniref:Uncharacterized protein n=1 Tax=Rhizopogon vesiculosus TaxID=180088 RepID=A0A1J8QEC1_9AGAM|nr:hypothetical protein AZE42_00452 [Rhizopogon vesiculosus]
MTTIPLVPLSLEPGANRPARKENKVGSVTGNSANTSSFFHIRPYTLYHQFVAFFRSRSRSRSRSRAKSSPNSSAAQSTTELPALPTLPKPRISHARSTSLVNEPGHTGHARTAPTATQPILKPATRISSRPISSTTTATHSTITPLPSDSIRRRQRLARNVYSHDYQGEYADHQANEDPATSHDDHDSTPRSDTPSSINQRRKLELLSIFGIGLSRKSSSNSSRKPSSGSSNCKVSSSTLSQKEAESKPSRKRSFRLNSRPSTPKSVDEPRFMKTSTSTLPTPSSPLPLSASPRRLSFGLTSSSRTHAPMTSSGHLPLAHSSRQGKRHSVGSHDTAHDSAVALPDDHSDDAVSSSHLDAKSGSNTDASKLSHTGRSRKGKDQERNNSKWAPTRKTSRTDGSRLGTFHSLSEETSLIVNISPPQNEVSALHTVESSEEDVAEPLPVIRAPQARSAIPQIIHTPPTPQRAAEVEPLVRPATTPPRLSGGKGRPREVVLSQEAVAVHNELPKLHARPPAQGDSGSNPRIRNRFSPRLFGGKDLSREKESKEQQPGHDPAHPAGPVGPPRNITSRRIKHGSFDFERPVSSLNRSNSTVNASAVKGEGSTQSRKNGVATHRPIALERTTSSSSGKSRTYAYHPARPDSPMLAQLSPHHTGETSVISFSSQSAQSKSTGKNSTPVPGQSSSWGRSSGRRAQRTSHGPFPFEPAVSAPNSPLPASSSLPCYSPKSSSHRVEFEVPEEPASMPTSSPLRCEFGRGGGSLRDNSQSARARGQREREQRIEKKGKGRSLDLNLGLSWAPNRVRQEAVMPGLLLSQAVSRKHEEERRGKDVTKVFENVLSESGFEAFKKYVHRFDAHLMPLEGPRGLLARIEKLLTASQISQTEKVELLAQFARFVEGHSDD